MSDAPLLDYIAHARRSDPKESHLAAASVVHIRESQAQILDLLQTYGSMMDDEIYTMMKHAGNPISPSGQRTRRHELVQKGLVIDSGITRILPSKRRSICWKAI